MTDIASKLAELDALIAKSTSAPWKAQDRCVYHASYGEIAFAQPIEYVNCGDEKANAALIVWLINTGPALIRQAVEMERALKRPVTDEEFSAAYLDMFSLVHGDDTSENQSEPSADQRGAIICQILLRRRARAALQEQPARTEGSV